MELVERMKFVSGTAGELKWEVARMRQILDEVAAFFPHKIEADELTVEKIRNEFLTIAAKVSVLDDVLWEINTHADTIACNAKWATEEAQRLMADHENSAE